MNELAEQSSESAGQVDAAANVECWLRRMNWTVAFVVCLVVGGFAGVTLSKNLSQAKNPKCGLDWIMAACGSEETFETIVHGAIVKSQEDFEKQNPELFEPAFDLSEPILLEPITLQGFNGFDASASDR